MKWHLSTFATLPNLNFCPLFRKMLPACQSRGTGTASNNRVNGIVLQPKFEKKEGRKKWIGWCNHQKRLLALTGGAVATKSGVAGKLSRGVSRSWVVPFLPSLWQDQRLTRLKKLVRPELGFGRRAGPVCLFLVLWCLHLKRLS